MAASLTGSETTDTGEMGCSISLDAERNVIAVGRLVTGPTTRGDFVVSKFAGAPGHEHRRREIDSTAVRAEDFAPSAALSASRNVIAAGCLRNAAASSELAATELWRQEIHGSPPIGLANAASVAGDLIAAGVLPGDPAGCNFRDFAVTKFDGGPGTELWLRSVR